MFTLHSHCRSRVNVLKVIGTITSLVKAGVVPKWKCEVSVISKKKNLACGIVSVQFIVVLIC